MTHLDPRLGARLRRLPLPVLLGSMLVAGLCALLALNTASAAQELKQQNLTDSNANTSDVEQQLRRDLAAKQAPDALASAALAQGLVPNPNPAFLRLNADGSVTVLGAPTPASVPPAPVTPSASASPGVSASPGASASPGVSSSTGSARPSGSASAAASPGARSAAPVVTVTVTKLAPTPTSTPTSSGRSTASPSTRPRSSSTAPGGH
jgi:hypothetical protein